MMKLFFSKGKLLLQKIENEYRIPKANELDSIVPGTEHSESVGTYKGEECLCIQDDTVSDIPSDYEFVDVRSIPSLTDDTELFILAGTANHILHWSHSNRYCGCCGHKTIDKEDERAKLCPSCNTVIYPRISPAIITAIFRGDEILLAHNRNFKGKMHSLIAGFVEPGETLEACVAREIREEIGIKVNNIRYFNSQPWPFPDSLMIAFLADYESGEITVDGNEITEAAWFHADNLPEIPSSFSIAGKIIRWYQEQYSSH
ncbi:NADH pyrophosphatase [Anaerocolumna cellulosilytica]|uniref:NAD(+) diphosphatase n=1 Tax=Anaerocolumna cellulosilytica TaxID=433286 RepID=A0A6S6R2Y0_9FIRM|nr:NAD(+) diphosphatase [Anaerocolumna cellulosilytica]MBB5195641.1 NAD+ diphosphatase [Anaerocolumna cellulosilytica]BCJ93885.1 NADH pyrophosphatase [Anaerocolumna cellulosilytica]